MRYYNPINKNNTTMKSNVKLLPVLIIMIAMVKSVTAQNIAINSSGSLPDTSAMLDVSSTVKGFLAPRMTTTQRNNIVLPATGLLIYNTSTSSFNVNTGTAATPGWVPLASGTNSLNGLSGNTQTFATGTGGSDFTISSSGTVHTFNIPDAGSAARGLITTGTQTIAGAKSFTGNITVGGTLTVSSVGSGTASDSILTINSSGQVKMRTVSDVMATATMPVLLVAASRTTSYTTASGYSTLAYNSTTVNVGTAYNTSTGIFTAPATGLYEISFHNMYTVANSVNNRLNARIMVNGAVETEAAGSLTPYSGTTVAGTISARTVVQMSAGQTASVSIGGLNNTMTPSVSTGQHTFKILRLK